MVTHFGRRPFENSPSYWQRSRLGAWQRPQWLPTRQRKLPYTPPVGVSGKRRIGHSSAKARRRQLGNACAPEKGMLR